MRVARFATTALSVAVLLAALPVAAEDLTIVFKTTSGKDSSTSTQYLTAARMKVLGEGKLREGQVTAVKTAALARTLSEAHRRFRAQARHEGWEDPHLTHI